MQRSLDGLPGTEMLKLGFVRILPFTLCLDVLDASHATGGRVCEQYLSQYLINYLVENSTCQLIDFHKFIPTLQIGFRMIILLRRFPSWCHK